MIHLIMGSACRSHGASPASLLFVANLALFALAVPGPAVAQDREFERDILLRSARNAVARSDFTEAINRFEKLLARFPGEKSGRSEYAGVLARVKRLDDSLAQYLKVIEIDPERRELRSAIADVYIEKKDYRAARIQCEWLLARVPKDRQVRSKMALLALIEKQFEESLERYQQLLDEEFEDPDLWPRYLDAAASAKDLTDKQLHAAMRLYDRMHERPTKDATPLVRLAWVLRRLKQTKNSVVLLERALAISGGDRKIRLELADSAHEVGEFEKAEEHYKALLKTVPTTK